MISVHSPSPTPQAENQNSDEVEGLADLNPSLVKPCIQVNEKSVDATLSEPFPRFRHEELLEKPFDSELRRDMEFQEQLHQQLLKLFIEFHAWSVSRPELESTSVGETLVEQTQQILNREREQGMWSFLLENSRVHLLEFITRIKDAIAVLTGLGL